MPLHIIREDITRMAVDAIVAAGSARPGTHMPTGGVNGSIHKKAGERLLAALRRLGGIKTGAATLTQAYDLPCKYVIHTAGPKWQGGGYGEEVLLRACYREALQLADRKGFTSIAFPLISTGKYGYPKAEAMQAATAEIRQFLNDHDLDVYLVVYDREAFRVSSELFTGVRQFIDQHYVDQRYVPRNAREDDWAQRMAPAAPAPFFPEADSWSMGECGGEADSFASAAPMDAGGFDFREDEPFFGEAPEAAPSAPAPPPEPAPTAAKPSLFRPAAPKAPAPKEAAPMSAAVPPGLAQRLHQLDEGFAGTLLHLIDQKGMKDSACYRKANVDRKLFNKIKNTPGYTPKKSTVMAFCVALELDLHACRELLARAGYAMSHASMFDVIVEYFIVKGVYDVDIINQTLFAYDQDLLGSSAS